MGSSSGPGTHRGSGRRMRSDHLSGRITCLALPIPPAQLFVRAPQRQQSPAEIIVIGDTETEGIVAPSDGGSATCLGLYNNRELGCIPRIARAVRSGKVR